jgi:hypothetical protein
VWLLAWGTKARTQSHCVRQCRGQAAWADGNADSQLCWFGGPGLVKEKGGLDRSSTDGGYAKGMPRNTFVPLAVFPMKVPSSSVTIGEVVFVEGEARTVAVVTKTATSKY